MFNYHMVAIGGEGLKFGQSPNASAPDDTFGTGICDSKFVKFVASGLGRYVLCNMEFVQAMAGLSLDPVGEISW